MLLKQSLLGIVVFYTQKTPKRGKHSIDQGFVSLEDIFNVAFSLVCIECICHTDGTMHSTTIVPHPNSSTTIPEGNFDPFLKCA